MNLLINCELTAPPSEIGAFRTLTLYATIFKNMDCLVEARPEEIDFYYRWIKGNYAYDFIKQFVTPHEVGGIRIHQGVVKRITFNNLNHLILILNRRS